MPMSGIIYNKLAFLAFETITSLAEVLVIKILCNTAKTTATKTNTNIFSCRFKGNLDKIAIEVILNNRQRAKFSLVSRQNPPMRVMSGSFDAELKMIIKDIETKKLTHKI